MDLRHCTGVLSAGSDLGIIVPWMGAGRVVRESGKFETSEGQHNILLGWQLLARYGKEDGYSNAHMTSTTAF